MFDLSLAEIALIIVVAVMFIGPNELPVVIRAVAKAMKASRGFYREVRALFDDITREAGLKDEMEFIRGDDGKMYERYDHPLPPYVIKSDGPDGK